MGRFDITMRAARRTLNRQGFQSSDPVQRAYDERKAAAEKCHADSGEAERVAYRVLEAERIAAIDATGERR